MLFILFLKVFLIAILIFVGIFLIGYFLSGNREGKFKDHFKKT